MIYNGKTHDLKLRNTLFITAHHPVTKASLFLFLSPTYTVYSYN